MPYTPDPTDVSQPDGATVKASTAAPEFRALKSYIRDTILAGLVLKAPIASPTFTGTATFANATFSNSPLVPDVTLGDASLKAANTNFVTATSLSTVLPGAVGNDGLSISSNGADFLPRYSAADALAVLNYLGA